MAYTDPAPTHDVIALGSAIVDVLATSTDEFLVAHGLDKGSMSLIDSARADELYEAMGPAQEASGGSAANTAAGVASFGGRAGFIGKVRDDQLGEVFAHDITSIGVDYTNPDLKHTAPWLTKKTLLAPRFQFNNLDVRNAVEGSCVAVIGGTSPQQAAEKAQTIVDQNRKS